MTLSSKAEEICKSRYFDEHETKWDQLSKRVGYGIGGTEYGETFSTMINDMLFIPAGRILRNADTRNGSLFNCYSIPVGDSLREIGECNKSALMVWGKGGGVGINFSSLRPLGAAIRQGDAQSSGLVSFLRAINSFAGTIESGGERRAASLGLCEVWHPEIKHFINAKLMDGEIKYFNISVGITKEFLEAVRCDGEWPLHFNQKEFQRINARSLWNLVIRNMHKNGEPGLLNMSNLTKNNSYYFAPVRSTNPCGEAPLEDWGCCCLGSLVLPKFATNTGRMKWSLLEEVINRGIHFLDNCIDHNNYTMEQIKSSAQKGRRIGLGVMGLADLLFKCGIRYGSPDAIDFCDNLFKRIRNYAYTASIKLAVEKGSFPAFDSNLYCKSSFISKGFSPAIRKDIRTYGTRNVTLLAMAPTGTISVIQEVWSGIEPLMCKAYERNDRVSKRVYIHPHYRDPGTANADWFVDSTDLSPNEHIETQTAIQRFTDGAVSKTINIPKHYKASELSGTILESISDLKGMTVYRNGSRDNQVIRPLSTKEVAERLKTNPKESNSVSEAMVACPTGTCEI